MENIGYLSACGYGVFVSSVWKKTYSIENKTSVVLLFDKGVYPENSCVS